MHEEESVQSLILCLPKTAKSQKLILACHSPFCSYRLKGPPSSSFWCVTSCSLLLFRPHISDGKGPPDSSSGTTLPLPCGNPYE
mmetsp:Transcript_21521/g.31202  ORF Transcript_21521/g.31202 Transcript_21521/m.31202 type:complete len:84 (-) Transcript_21521:2025-2276(-)